MNQNSLITSLHQSNIKPSYPRIRILDYLITKNHPTVDEIYTELVKEIPTLSKTTVYNTLYLFKSKGIARSLSIDESETRYDYNTENHGHFQCLQCENIYDFVINIPSKPKTLEKFIIQEKNYFYKGICDKCND